LGCNGGPSKASRDSVFVRNEFLSLDT